MSVHTVSMQAAEADGVRVVAVTVAHRPDASRLQAQLAALVDQVAAVVVVENEAQADLAQRLAAQATGQPRVWHIPLTGNEGLARAQNLGIARARAEGATHVLLMDDDSIPQPQMVPRLLAALQAHRDAAAAGPWYRDARVAQAHSPFVRIDGLRMTRLPCTDDTPPMPVDHLIASGCLIPLTVLDRVGPMREDFFIDFVDVEWCLRARHAGHTVLGVCSAQLEHRLGGAPVRWLGREFLNHAPWRLYYQVRNACLIYRAPWVPLNWKLVSAWRLLLKTGFRVLVGPHRIAHAGWAMRGWLDAWGRRRFDPLQR